jgi:hypothetical protein
MLDEKLWPSYDTRRMIKWSIPSATTSRVEHVRELKLRCCLWWFMTALDALPTK